MRRGDLRRSEHTLIGQLNRFAKFAKKDRPQQHILVKNGNVTMVSGIGFDFALAFGLLTYFQAICACPVLYAACAQRVGHHLIKL